MKTAVEYLIKEFSDIIGPLETNGTQDLLMTYAIKEAKVMEEQQQVEFAFKAYSEMLSSGKSFVDVINSMRTFNQAEQWK